MLKGKNLSRESWGEMVSTFAYLLNMCPKKKFKKITLEEAWSGLKPNMTHLRVFGLVVYQMCRINLERSLLTRENR